MFPANLLFLNDNLFFADRFDAWVLVDWTIVTTSTLVGAVLMVSRIHAIFHVYYWAEPVYENRDGLEALKEFLENERERPKCDRILNPGEVSI